MASQLYINNDLVELGEGARIPITFQVQNPEKVDSFQSNFSTNFDIPATSYNQTILGYVGDLNMVDNKPYIKLGVTYFFNGEELISNGYLRYTKNEDRFSNVSVFRCQIFSGFTDIFQIIKNKKISELDFSSSNHFQNASGIDTSQTHTYNDVYIYDIIKRGFPSDLYQNYALFMFPSVFEKAVFDKIFSEAGFTYSGNIPSHHENVIIPFNKDESNTEKAYKQLLIDNSAKAILTNDFTVPGAETNLVFDNDSSRGAFDKLNRYSNTVGNYTVFSNYTTASTKGKVNLSVTGGSVRVIFRQGSQVGPFGTILGEKVIDASTEDKVESLQVIRDSDTSPSPGMICKVVRVSGSPVIQSGSSIEFEPLELLSFGSPPTSEWDIAANLPDINQGDLVKEVAVRYGLFFVPSKANSTNIEIRQFKEVYDNLVAGTHEDWSGKLDVSRGKITEYTFEDFAQSNLLKYKGDIETGNGQLLVSNINLESEKDVYESIYEASETLYDQTLLVENFFNNIVMDMAVFPNDVIVPDLGTSPTSAQAYAAKRKYIEGFSNISRSGTDPRVLYLERNSGIPFTIVPYFIGGTPVTILSPCRSKFLPEMSFATSVTNYYQTYTSLLDDTKKIIVYLKLNEVDISNLDYTIPKWIDFYKSFFFLSKIEQWVDSNEAVKCTLYKLNP